MNKPMMAAAVLSAVTLVIYVIGGGQDVHAPIQASDLELPLRAISAVIWHFVSLILAVQAVGLFAVARRPNPQLAGMLIAIQIGTAGLFVFFGVTMLGTLWIMPQWVIFGTLGALGLWGMKKGAPQRPL